MYAYSINFISGSYRMTLSGLCNPAMIGLEHLYNKYNNYLLVHSITI